MNSKFKIIRDIIVTLLSIIVIVALIIAWKNAKETPSPSNKPEGKYIHETSTFSGETTKATIEKIGELATAEYNYSHVETGKNSKTIGIHEKEINVPLTENSFIYSIDGCIKAGIDFTQVDVIVDDDAKKIDITLPAPKILSSELYLDTYELYDQKNGLFNSISIDDVIISEKDVKADEEQKAEKKGLFKDAKDNAKVLINAAISSMPGIEDYEVNITFEK